MRNTTTNTPHASEKDWLVPVMQGFLPGFAILSQITKQENLRTVTKGRFSIDESSFVTPAVSIINAYLANGATCVPNEPSEPVNRGIQYHFGALGPPARNRSDGTPWMPEGGKEGRRALNAGEFNEAYLLLLEAGMVSGEIDPKHLTKDTKFIEALKNSEGGTKRRICLCFCEIWLGRV